MADITLTGYSDAAAYAVLSRLDPADLAEAEVTRGSATNGLTLFAEWRALQAGAEVSLVVRAGRSLQGTPIALFVLTGTGQAGVAVVGLMACSHRTWRPELRCLAVQLRRQMPDFARTRGLHRIEARCWARHPSAYGLLAALGFKHEAHLYGFGAKGTETFHQFAYITPEPPKETDHVL